MTPFAIELKDVPAYHSPDAIRGRAHPSWTRCAVSLLSRLLRRLRSRSMSGMSAHPSTVAALVSSAAPVVDPDPVFVETKDEPSVGRFAVMREAVLDRGMGVTGYAFSLADAASPTRYELERDKTLLQYVCGESARKLVGDRLSFVSIGQKMLAEPMVEFLALAKTTPVLRAASPAVGEDLPIERLLALKRAGVSVGVEDGRALMNSEALANAVSVAFFPVIGILPPDLLQMSRHLLGQYPELRLGIRGVETQEEFDACSRLGFSYFQGPFIRRREQWSQHQVSASALRICDLLARMRKGAELDEIAEEVRLDPMISFRILRLANSAAAAVTQPVTSIRDAMLINGRDALYRWFVMLLCSSTAESPTHQALVEIALARGRLMELLAPADANPASRQSLFLTGMLSLLDVMLKVPMPAILSQLTLPPEVSEAVANRSGPCAQLLQLAEACDQGDQPRIMALAGEINIDLDILNQATADAGAWARQSLQESGA